MKLYLLDTNILIYALANKKPWASRFRKWIKNKQAAISAITAAEFLTGASPQEAKKFELFLDEFGTLPVETSTARLAAEYRKEFLRQGRNLKLPDCLIAATAKYYQATLVTSNLADYPMKDIAILF